MQSLANAGNREHWNRGCGHADGKPVLSAEQISELTPQATEATEEAPPQQPAAAAPQRVAKPAPRAAAAAAPEPDPAPAASEQEEPGEDSIQRELV
jgi:hypothetical protein